jgi:acylphosphatase
MSEDENPLSRLQALVEGRVQGVGFRYFVEERAISLGLTGWVRNRWDGGLEVLVEGDRCSLEQLLADLHRGPRSAHVTTVRTEWLPATGEFTRFQVRMTA